MFASCVGEGRLKKSRFPLARDVSCFTSAIRYVYLPWVLCISFDSWAFSFLFYSAHRVPVPRAYLLSFFFSFFPSFLLGPTNIRRRSSRHAGARLWSTNGMPFNAKCCKTTTSVPCSQETGMTFASSR
jgi:hypothetical protein